MPFIAPMSALYQFKILRDWRLDRDLLLRSYRVIREYIFQAIMVLF